MKVLLLACMRRTLAVCCLVLCLATLQGEQHTALAAVHAGYSVGVIIESVTALDDIDSLFGNADFYAYITIDGVTTRTPVVDDANDIQPNWSHVVQVPAGRTEVTVEIALWDEDGGLNGSDDHVDIQGDSGRDLAFAVNLAACNGTCVTALTSSGTQDTRAGIQLRTEVMRIPDPYNLYIPYITDF